MNQKGFGPILIALIAATISVTAVAGWKVYESTKQKPSVAPNTTQPAIKAPQEKPQDPPLAPQEPPTDCTRNGIIIVMFNSTVAKERTLEIISKENATIHRTYESFNGYALNVKRGEEVAAVASFKQYSEVNTSGLNECASINSSPNSTN